MEKREIIQNIAGQADRYFSISDGIWDMPEPGFSEYESSKLLAEELEREGFDVEWGLAGIATAFRCSWGTGGPVIGFLGEFDALPGMSQEAGIAEIKPVTPGGCGHGCGHNLLGVGALMGAVGTKRYLKENELPGTVVFFGCPAEEGGSAKTFMAREGCFDGIDCALTWHPGSVNAVFPGIMLANAMIQYCFEGTASHAAASPEQGRSALDALELMNIGIQFLREHVPSTARIHYAITDTGGEAPNIVQATASGIYKIRAPYTPMVSDIAQRIDKIAQGAALMTETRVKSRFVTATSNTVPNNVLERIIYRNMENIQCPGNDTMEIGFAEKIVRSQLPEENWPEKPMADRLLEYSEKEVIISASSDVGDVSWVCPVAQLSAATWPVGTAAHSWQAVACGKSDFAHRAMLYAGQVLAATAIDLCEDPQVLERAWEELRRRTKGQPYKCPIPVDIEPPCKRNRQHERRDGHM